MSVINLRNYLRNVSEIFNSYVAELSVDEKNSFRTACNSMFDSGVADYDNEYIVAYYVLKFARTYGFQFSRAYADIFSDMDRLITAENKAASTVKAISVGCGTGIDYWGMTYAARALHMGEGWRLDYTGIDPQDWYFKITDGQDIEDTVRYNSLFDGSPCRDFEMLLSHMESNPEEELSDVYFFPHSIKEVCIHTVNHDGEFGHAYNRFQSMVRFANQIAAKLKDKPVYVAFTYRQRPGCNAEDYMYMNEAYDTGYGTCLYSCLKNKGLDIQLLDTVEFNEDSGCSLEICDVEEDASLDMKSAFFDYDELHSYTSWNGGHVEISRLTRDRNGYFNKIVSNNPEDDAFYTYNEWKELLPTDVEGEFLQLPMDYFEKGCYQIFKISKPFGYECHNDDNKTLQIFEEIFRNFWMFHPDFDRDNNDNGNGRVIYKTDEFNSFVKKIHDFPYNNFERSLDIIERITGIRPDNLWSIQNRIDKDVILDRLWDMNYLTYENHLQGREYHVTPLGNKMGLLTKNDNRELHLNRHAQEYILTNVICGKYLTRN